MPKLPTKARATLGGVGVGASRINTRQATATDFGGGVAGAAAELSRTVADAGSTYITQKESAEQRTSVVQHASIRAEYAARLDAARTNGEDVEKIREEMQDRLSHVGEDFITQKGRDSAAIGSSNSEALFQAKANALSVAKARDAAVLEMREWEKKSILALTRDDTQLPLWEDDARKLAAGLLNITPEKRAGYELDMIQSANLTAASGLARRDPDGAREALKAGKFNLSAAQTEIVKNHADETEREARSTERYNHTLKVEKEKEVNDDAADAIMTRLRKGEDVNKAIRDNPDLTAPTKRLLYSALDARANQDAQGKPSNNAIFSRFYVRANSSGGLDKTFHSDVLAATADHGEGRPGLLVSDAESLLKLARDRRDPFGHTIGSRVNGEVDRATRSLASNFIIASDQTGLLREAVGQVQRDITEAVSRYTQDDKMNVDDLFNPAKPDWVGSENFLQRSVSVVKARRKQAVDAAIAAKTTEMPGGGTGYWSQKGDIEDVSTWIIVTPAPKTEAQKKAEAPPEPPKLTGHAARTGGSAAGVTKVLEGAFVPKAGGTGPRGRGR